VVHDFWPAATASSGAYALVGAGAVVAAATHAPLTAFMIIFELTGDYKIILPLMIACVIATMLAARIKGESIYTMKLVRRGLDLYKGRSLNVLSHLQASEVMCEPESKVNSRANLFELLSLFMANRHNSIFVLGNGDRLEGVINFDDLRPYLGMTHKAGRAIMAFDIMQTKGYPVVRPEDPLDKVIRQLGQYQYEVPVVSDGILVGAIQVQDVIQHYNTEMFKRETASSMVTSMEDVGRFTPMPGVSGMSLAEVPVPAAFRNRSCAELDLRNSYGVTVLLVKKKRAGGAEIVGRVPDGRYEFGEDEMMLVMGSPADLRRIQDMV
jgi:CIC family chloride channel protein